MDQDQSSLTEVTPKGNSTLGGFFYRRAVLPLLALLRMGVSPETLAWSFATGVVIGINPLLGSTTILCLAIAIAFRLNLVASQLGNHIVYPLELLLFIPFLRAGRVLFRSPPVPLAPHDILQAARNHPIALVKQLWMWEWHALVIWAIVSTITLPLLALLLTPLMRRLMKTQQPDYLGP